VTTLCSTITASAMEFLLVMYIHLVCCMFRCTIPELNPEMDVYRIGTLLEMVREMAYALAEDGKLVKVCVQQSMGQGVFQVCA